MNSYTIYFTDSDEGLNAIPVAVNLSRQHFKNYNLVYAVQQALQVSGLASCWLELEITERILMEDLDATLNMLHEIQEMGCRLSMDDFGIGYSSFVHLKQLPLDRIKIDPSFVKDIPQNPDNLAIVKAIIAMATSLNISVMAEGVETEAQQTGLLGEGCSHVQGYLFSRPLPALELGKLLKKCGETGPCRNDNNAN